MIRMSWENPVHSESCFTCCHFNFSKSNVVLNWLGRIGRLCYHSGLPLSVNYSLKMKNDKGLQAKKMSITSVHTKCYTTDWNIKVTKCLNNWLIKQIYQISSYFLRFILLLFFILYESYMNKSNIFWFWAVGWTNSKSWEAFFIIFWY